MIVSTRHCGVAKELPMVEVDSVPLVSQLQSVQPGPEHVAS